MLITLISITDHRVFELLRMLSTLEPLKRHQDIKFPRSKNSGTWLLELESFSKWRDSQTIEENGRVFCCYGIPGAGKTVIRYEANPPTAPGTLNKSMPAKTIYLVQL